MRQNKVTPYSECLAASLFSRDAVFLFTFRFNLGTHMLEEGL